ncbi:ranBP2-type zinc finger protein At1g67325-like isoform X2 [Tasmannia lanceolata]|uniref:ranBP2-type zinc finger protein At1g67325-like isoform X2 n=1 Tax=Tasmannia lanceolata TaxID=3420 RepID=UPI0040631706
MASSKVDNQGSFGLKRSRNDASQNDGDWTCPLCANVNFGFRTVCNRGTCGATRPSTTQKMGSAPLPATFDHAPPFYFGGVGAPSPLPIGMYSGYGPSLSLSGLRYDYGAPTSAAGPYGLLHAYVSPGPLGGMGYGPPGHAMDRYGFGFPGSPLPVPGPWTEGGLPDNNAPRKRRGGPDGLSEGDWICPKCDNVNFSFRTTCNMKCGTARPTTDSNGLSGNKDSGSPEGSWTCDKCGNLNYPFRTVCNRKGCGKEKPTAGK